VNTEHLRCGRFSLPLERPLIMGILNVTPDSFSDGGRFYDAPRAIAQAHSLIEQGADILDVGGESTRPYAEPVALSEELDRVLPILEALRKVDVPMSVDTYKPQVMRAAIAAGASMINDVMALQSAGAIEAICESDCAVCLMHMKGTPQTMQDDPRYDDVIAEVSDFLKQRVTACERAGIARERLLIDPGFGFGKRSTHNLTLLREFARFSDIGVPVLAGISRKGILGKITGRPTADRANISAAAALLLAQRGAAIVRVHDVEQTRDTLRLLRAVQDRDFRFDD
jgi:dihydropteroate synthase